MQVPIPSYLSPLFRPLTPRTKAPRERVKTERQPRPSYGELHIYETDQIWMRLFPLEELARRLPLGCAYFYDQQTYRIQGIAIGGPVGLIALGGVGWALAATLGVVLFGLMGGLIGLAAGWLIGPQLCPRPVFLVRRTPQELEGTRRYDLTPIEHSYLMGAVDLEKITEESKPGVFLGSSWDSIIQARAARRFFTSIITKGQMLQMAAPVVIAVCSVLVVFFLVMASR